MNELLWRKGFRPVLEVSLVLVACAANVPSMQSQEVKETPPDPKDQAAWTSAGFKFGWMVVKDGGDTVFDEKQKVGGLPSFRFSRHFKGMNLATLPAITVPFGLYLDDSPVDDAFLEGLARFKMLQSLCIRFGPITDVGMNEIAKLKELTHLEVSCVGNRANVDDATQTKDFNEGVKRFAALTKLTVLNLSQTRTADESIKHLGQLKRLQVLNLQATRITDGCLEALSGLAALTTLDIRDTETSKEGVERLSKALPKVSILSAKE